jgi:uncharacterized protein (DUF427 family)
MEVRKFSLSIDYTGKKYTLKCEQFTRYRKPQVRVVAENSTFPTVTFFETDDNPVYYFPLNSEKIDGYQKKVAGVLAKYLKERSD